MNFLSGQDEFRGGQDDFFQTANRPISVRHIVRHNLLTDNIQIHDNYGKF